MEDLPEDSQGMENTLEASPGPVDLSEDSPEVSPNDSSGLYELH